MPKLSLILSSLFALLIIPSFAFAGLIVGDYNVLPASLPQGFTPWAGTKSPDGSYIVAGSFNNQPAYLTVTKNPDGSGQLSGITVLPSLKVAAGGNDNYGRIRDVYYNSNGQLEFVGSSATPNLPIDEGAGEGTLWNAAGEPTGFGHLTGAIESTALQGSRNGLYVGASDTRPALYAVGNTPISLSSAPFGGATAISKDGTVIGGAAGTELAYWTADVIGSSYSERTVDLPEGGFNNGIIYSVEDNWLAGIYFSETIMDFAAAIWNSADGAVVADFAMLGAASDTVIESIDGVKVVGINYALENGGPVLFIEGSSSVISVASLFHDLAPEMGAISHLVDIFPGTLSVLALTTNGQYVFSSFQTSGGNAVPEPATMLLTGIALVGVRSFKKARQEPPHSTNT